MKLARLSLFARLAALALALALAAAGVSCSSAPKAPDAVLEAKNNAADLAKLGDGYLAKALYAKALQYYSESLSASQAVDDLEGASAAQASMGRAYLGAGDADSAEREYRDSLDYGRMAGSAPAQAIAKAGLGEVAFAKGDKAGALALFGEAVVLADSGAKDTKALAVTLHDRGVAKAALGRRVEALADFSKAESLNLKAKRWSELGANRYAEAAALAASGKAQEALAAALGALDADKRGENARAVPLDLAAAAGLSAKLGKDAEAWDYWRRSFDSALADDDTVSVRKALSSLIELAPKTGEVEEGKRYEALLAQLDQAQSKSAAPASPASAPAPKP